MLPKKSKDFIKDISEELNLDEMYVQDVVNFYYSTLRTTLSNLEHHTIQIENLGSFKAKTNSLPKLIMKHMTHLEHLKADTFHKMSIKKDVEDKLEKAIALQKMIKEENKRKWEFFKAKKDGKLK